jgi:hypothetical protein
MKKLLLSLLLVSLFVSCTVTVQDDLLNYINVELPKLADLESQATKAYASVSGENYQNDSLMYYTIQQNVIPPYEEFNSIIKTIKPSSPEVQAMHNEYVEAAKDQLEAFHLVLEAIEKQDPEIINKANEDLDKAQQLIIYWRKDLDEACKKYDVVLE